MNKSTALWVMLIGAGLSAVDLATTKQGDTAGALYGPDKPLHSLRWKVYTRDATPANGTTAATPAKDYYLSASDAAAIIGAYFYFR